MTNTICRLCLNETQLINIFDILLTNTDQLRKCILLATGVEITHDDIVSKYVCQYCSDIAIFLYKYRKKALANDKALKEYANQKATETLSRPKDIANFNNQILDTMKDEMITEGSPGTLNIQSILDDKPSKQLPAKAPDTSSKKPAACSNLAVHPTIIQLIKTNPRLKIPNHLLKCDIQPKVVVKHQEIDNWRLMQKQRMAVVAKKEISAMERFRMKCPGISIKKITEPIENKQCPGLSVAKVTEHAVGEQVQPTEDRQMPVAEDKQAQPAEKKRVQFPEKKQVEPIENRQVLTIDNRRVHIAEKKQVEPIENRQVLTIDNRRVHIAEKKQVEPIENRQVLTIDNRRVHIAEKKQVEPIENRQVLTIDSRRVHIAENKQVEPIENRQVLIIDNGRIQQVLTIDDKRIQPVEGKQVQPVEKNQVQPDENKQLRPANAFEDVESILCGTVIKRSEKTEALNNNVLKKRKLSESPSDMSKRKKLKDHDVSNTESKVNSTKKRHLSKPQATASDEEQLPKIKIVLRKPNSEDDSRQATLQGFSHESSLKDSFQEFQRVPDRNTEVKPQSQESDNENISPVKLAKNNLFGSDSELSDNDWAGDVNDASSSEDLLDTVEEEQALHCSVCNKIFNTERQLKNHERAHKICAVCKMIFRSADALRYHEQDVCFKTVVGNPPILRLNKVDEDPEMVKTYPGAFGVLKRLLSNDKSTVKNQPMGTTTNADEVFCISDDDDDDDVILVDSSTADGDYSLLDEYQRIRRIFQKYRNAKIGHSKQRYTETNLKINIRVNQKNQIVLENMYPELKTYRVPVELVASTSCTASISFSKKPPEPKDIYCWATEPVTKLSERKQLMSILLNPPPVQTKFQHILPKTAHPQYKKPETQPTTHYTVQTLKHLPAPAAASNLAPKKTTTPPSTFKKNPPQPTPQAIPSTGVTMTLNRYAPQPVPQTIPSTTLTSLITSVLDMPLVNETVIPNEIAQQPAPQTIPSTPGTSLVTSESASASNNGMQPMDVQPSTSTTPKETFSLRVKTPWELNTAL